MVKTVQSNKAAKAVAVAVPEPKGKAGKQYETSEAARVRLSAEKKAKTKE